MYIAVCVLLMTGFTFLSYLHLHRKAFWLAAAEGILFGAGILLFPLVYCLLSVSLQGQSTDFAAWAWDNLSAYTQYAFPALGIFFTLTLFCALSPLWDKKYRSPLWIRMRTLASLVCSLVLLALAGFFGILSATETIPLEGYIKALGVGSALVLRGMYLAEALWQKKCL